MQKDIRVYSKWEKQKKNNINAIERGRHTYVQWFLLSSSCCLSLSTDEKTSAFIPVIANSYFSFKSMFYIYSIIVINHLCQPDNYITALNLFEAFVQPLHDKIKNKGIHFVNFETLKLPEVFSQKSESKKESRID